MSDAMDITYAEFADAITRSEQVGADLERRRIRRALSKVRMAGGPSGPFYWGRDVDAATRKKGKRT